MSKVLLADEVVVKYIKNGGDDRLKALQQIYNHPGLKDRVISYVLHYGGQHEEGYDIFVESIVVTERNIRKDKFMGNSAISTYIIGVAKKLWSNKQKLKKQYTLQMDEVYEGLTDFQNPELIFISDEMKSKLTNVIELLSEKCRKVIRLWSNGMKYSEIAVEMSVENSSQLRKMKYDCQQKLRDELLVRPELIPNYYNGKLGRK